MKKNKRGRSQIKSKKINIIQSNDAAHSSGSESYSQAHNLDRARSNWLLGEWEKISQMAESFPLDHPQRASLALFVSSGKQHLGEELSSKEWLEKALHWGCSMRTVSSVLISDVHNTVARLQAMKGDMEAAKAHFENALEISGSPQDVDFPAKSRAVKELSRLGLIDEALDVTEKVFNGVSFSQKTEVEAVKKMQADIRASQKVLQRQQAISAGACELDMREVWQLAESCFDHSDVQLAIDQAFFSREWSLEQRYYFSTAIAELMGIHNDRLQAISWINQARLFLINETVPQRVIKYHELSEIAARFNQPDLAVDISVEASLSNISLEEAKRNSIKATYYRMRCTSEKNQQHGHDLLMDYLEKVYSKAETEQPKRSKAAGCVMIEIGTTRENVPGQGSTLQLADIAMRQGMRFISVDMDPHNSRWAQFNMELLKLPGKAVAEKGEIFLQQFSEQIDYAFLDAYDFDHGKHSELRQQRYQKYMGSKIDEKQCHRMHLACAESLVDKLSSEGVVCIDDAWKDDAGHWTAKGTLAVPYLIQNGFEIIDARNHAVLMRRRADV